MLGVISPDGVEHVHGAVHCTAREQASVRGVGDRHDEFVVRAVLRFGLVSLLCQPKNVDISSLASRRYQISLRLPRESNVRDRAGTGAQQRECNTARQTTSRQLREDMHVAISSALAQHVGIRAVCPPHLWV